jgi:thiol-disulfide isomerase/thioredoxin
MTRIAKIVVLIITAILLCPDSASGQGQVNLQEVMRQPGVKLVAVEFWADWCKPCVKAIPKWRELHEKYRDQGFRLIMVGVNTSGKCSTPGWVPDRIVCDYTGEIAKAWNATDLPEGFLWTWQGNLLMEHATVEEIAHQMEQWFDETPRIVIRNPTNEKGHKISGGSRLKKLVRTELRRQAKFDIVLDKKELKALEKLRRESHGVDYSDEQRCRMGMQVSPNSTLSITVIGTKQKRLLLELFSLEKACLVASAIAPMAASSNGMEKATIEAVAKLTSLLTGSVHTPGSRGTNTVKERESVQTPTSINGGAREEVIRGTGSSVDLGVSEFILTVVTEPEGAMVSVDGAPPRSTGTRFLLPKGPHKISVFKEWYTSDQHQITLTENRRVEVTLEPNWGTIRVKSDPPDAKVRINGETVGSTPFERRFAPGGYRVKLEKPQYLSYEKQFNLERGKKKSINRKLDPNFATLSVATIPEDVQVLVNGAKLGKTPLVGLHLPPGAVDLALEKDGFHPVTVKGLTLKVGKSRSISETLKPILGGLKVVVLDRNKAPLTAEIVIDGENSGKAPLARELTIGKHVVTARFKDLETKETVRIKDGKVKRIDLVLDNWPPEKSEQLLVNKTNPVVIMGSEFGKPTVTKASRLSSQAPWWLVGGGSAFLVSGLTMVAVSSVRKNDITSSDTLSQEQAQRQWNSANNLATAGWVNTVMGGVTAASGVLWWVLARDDAGSVALMPVISPTGTSATFSLSF